MTDRIPPSESRLPLHIQEIVNRDKTAFDIALKTHEPSSLLLPPDARRYVIVPARLLELVQRPDKIIVALTNDTDYLRGTIFEPAKPKKPILDIRLLRKEYQPNYPVLYVDDYRDHKDYRHSGVATDYYKRLHEIAKQLGFKAIVGTNNNKRALRFFRDKLGWVTLEHIHPEMRNYFKEKSNFPDSMHQYALYNRTIDILSDQDRFQMVV